METKSQNGFVIRLFRPNDAPGVRAVLEATYGAKATPAATYNWWSLGFTGATSGFTVAEANEKIVGVQPMEIFPYTDGAKQLKGGVLTGVAVHPDFRRRGIFSALVRGCEAEAWRQGAAFVTSMPNERSQPGFVKMGYTDLGRRQLLVRPLRPCAMGGKALPVLGHLAGAAAGLGQSMAKRIPSAKGYSVREINSTDTELELLAQKHDELFPGLRMERNSGWWRWRFLESPLRQYRILEVRTPNAKPVGLAAYALDAREKFKVCYLMDLLVAEEAAVPALVSCVCEKALADGADATAAVVSSQKLANLLSASGFWAMPDWLPIKKFYSVALFNPIQSTPQNWRTLTGWYQTLADWDNL